MRTVLIQLGFLATFCHGQGQTFTSWEDLLNNGEVDPSNPSSQTVRETTEDLMTQVLEILDQDIDSILNRDDRCALKAEVAKVTLTNAILDALSHLYSDPANYDPDTGDNLNCNDVQMQRAEDPQPDIEIVVNNPEDIDGLEVSVDPVDDPDADDEITFAVVNVDDGDETSVQYATFDDENQFTIAVKVAHGSPTVLEVILCTVNMGIPGCPNYAEIANNFETLEDRSAGGIEKRHHAGAFVDNQNYQFSDVESLVEDFLTHGCWCSTLTGYSIDVLPPIHGGHPIDDLDEICRDWIMARKCLLEEGGTCHFTDAEKTLLGLSPSSGAHNPQDTQDLRNRLYVWDNNVYCDDQASQSPHADLQTCLQHTCETDATYAMKLWEFYTMLIDNKDEDDTLDWDFRSRFDDDVLQYCIDTRHEDPLNHNPTPNQFSASSNTVTGGGNGGSADNDQVQASSQCQNLRAEIVAEMNELKQTIVDTNTALHEAESIDEADHMEVIQNTFDVDGF